MYALAQRRQRLAEAFTCQHYNAIAAILQKAMGGSRIRIATVSEIAEALAEMFEKDNPGFDKGIFLARSGV